MLEKILHHKLLKEGAQGQGVVTVPVRYDASDHSKVVLDVIALEEAKQAADEQEEDRQKQQKAAAIAQAEAEAAQANARAANDP